MQATGCTYWIRPGDNLFRIGLRYGVSYTYLASINGIPNPNLIYAGTTIAVPCGAGAPPAIPANCQPSQSYTVVAGDNLWRIAYNFKTDLNLLIATNHMYGRVLRPGMVLTIPCPNSVQYAEVPPVSGNPPPSGGVTPIVTPPATVPPVATPPPAGPQIYIQSGGFSQTALQVLPGTTITWVNQDTNNHTIVIGSSGQPLATSPSIVPNGTWSYTFATEGVYDFSFKSNPAITGTITVRNP